MGNFSQVEAGLNYITKKNKMVEHKLVWGNTYKAKNYAFLAAMRRKLNHFVKNFVCPYGKSFIPVTKILANTGFGPAASHMNTKKLLYKEKSDPRGEISETEPPRSL